MRYVPLNCSISTVFFFLKKEKYTRRHYFLLESYLPMRMAKSLYVIRIRLTTSIRKKRYINLEKHVIYRFNYSIIAATETFYFLFLVY